MVSTAKVSHFLKGINFPANKRKVIDYARQHNAPGDVVNALENMSGDNFDSMAGVWHAVGQRK
jgi:hypothetical protein